MIGNVLDIGTVQLLELSTFSNIHKKLGFIFICIPSLLSLVLMWEPPSESKTSTVRVVRLEALGKVKLNEYLGKAR